MCSYVFSIFLYPVSICDVFSPGNMFHVPGSGSDGSSSRPRSCSYGSFLWFEEVQVHWIVEILALVSRHSILTNQLTS